MESGDEEEMRGRDYERMYKNLEKNGFREGIQVGKSEGLQSAFEEGYNTVCSISYALGQLFGKIELEITTNASNESLLLQLNKLKFRVIEEISKIETDFGGEGKSAIKELTKAKTDEMEGKRREIEEEFIKLCPNY